MEEGGFCTAKSTSARYIAFFMQQFNQKILIWHLTFLYIYFKNKFILHGTKRKRQMSAFLSCNFQQTSVNTSAASKNKLYRSKQLYD